MLVNLDLDFQNFLGCFGKQIFWVGKFLIFVNYLLALFINYEHFQYLTSVAEEPRRLRPAQNDNGA